MEHSYFHRLSSVLWGVIIALVVVLAVYVSFGRLLMFNVERYHAQILQHLNNRVPFHIEAEKVSGQLRSFSPEIVLTGLRISIPNSSEPPIELAEGRISFHPLKSLGAWFPQITKLRLQGLSLQGERTPDGKWIFNGLGSEDNATTDWLEELLLNIESVDITNNSLVLNVPEQQPLLLQLDLALRRDGSKRRVEAKVRSLEYAVTATAIAQGVGSPLQSDSFAGQLYFDIKASDIAPFQGLLSTPAPIAFEGGVDTQIWLAWDNSEFTFEYELEAEQLKVSAADKSWQFPMQSLSMQARVLQDKEHWTVDASNMSIRKGDTTLSIPRLNLVSRGDSLHLTAADVPLASVNAMLVDMALTPEAIADVFAVLNTRGQLSSLQVDLADINDPLADWYLAANFQDFEVDSWRGAPGLTQGSGYLELNPGSGELIIDSQVFAMSYPTVYRDALAYDDFFGTVGISWDASDFTLSSGMMTATAEEGVAKVLFGLNVPLTADPVGLEMDLLVGLQNFDPSYRSKYLPYTLSDGLLSWLGTSIEQGVIEEGAFLWRGSLSQQRPMQKTVQLFFNVADTTLHYHPDWPSVTGLDGIVLIDDAQVSVWSENAVIHDSNISKLSAETWLNEASEMVLAIDGQLSGDAADGLKVVNHSPLTDLVGSTFSDWSLVGHLDTHLQLALNIGDSTSAPQIELTTSWTEVDAAIDPGGLTLKGLSGQLFYDSANGFSSSNMVGSLWGSAVEAQVRQTAPVAAASSVPAGEEGYRAGQSSIVVDMSTRVDMTDVKSWLQLDAISLAQGETDVTVEIKVTPGSGALLSVDSDLMGTALDLPIPWRKTATQSMPLHIETSLAEQGLLTKLTLANSLYLDMQLTDGKLDGMSLGLYLPPKKVELGTVNISGHVPLLDLEQWQQFVSRYFEGDVLASFGQEQGQSVVIEALQVDTLLIAGQDLRDVVIDLMPEAGGWLLSAETTWLAGQYLFAHPTEDARLDIRYLDLSQLSALDFDSFETTATDLEVAGQDVSPAVSSSVAENDVAADLIVSLNGIHRGPELLGSVNFIVHTEPDSLSALNINGELAGLTLVKERPGSLVWDTAADKTSLTAELEFEELGETLERLGYQKTLETENGELQLELEWPGGPQDFSLTDGMGSASATMGEGRFLNASAGASGALRVVSILNLADVIGRLSLSHMFESGVAFRGIEAQLFLQDAKIEVASMDVEGSSSGFQFSGVADIVGETLEGNLVVILPVANNLPWVVALAAGLPVAAGVFVVSQVFKEQVNRFSSGVYRISGPWADPQVEFVKIFDDSAKKKQEASVLEPNTQSAEKIDEALDSVVADPNAPVEPADPNIPVVLSGT